MLDGLDFSSKKVLKILESSTVFMIYLAMKVLFIGSSENIKKFSEAHQRNVFQNLLDSEGKIISKRLKMC